MYTLCYRLEICMRRFVIQLKQCPASRKEKLTGEVSHISDFFLRGSLNILLRSLKLVFISDWLKM